MQLYFRCLFEVKTMNIVAELTSSTLPKPPTPKVAIIDRSFKNSLENSLAWLGRATGGLGANLRLQYNMYHYLKGQYPDIKIFFAHISIYRMVFFMWIIWIVNYPIDLVN